MELGAVLGHALGVGPIIGDIEERIDLVDRQTAAFGPAAVVGDVEGDAKQIRLRAAHRSDLVHAFESQVGFLKHVRGNIRGAQSTRKLSIEAAVIRK
jgi:hypothetical protein